MKKKIEEKPFTALIDRKNKIIMDWSAKAGCTVGIQMFFQHMGILGEALAHGPWIHRYREDVYLKENCVNEENLKDPAYFKFKIVRNPYQRAVSSYIHAMKHRYEDEFIKEKFKTDNADITFRQFTKYLSRIDLYECNIHHQMQKKAFEKTIPNVFNYIVKLENLEYEINKINTLTMAKFDLAGLRIDRLQRQHYAKKDQRESPIVVDAPWSKLERNIPAYRYFYDRETMLKISEIYRDDLIQYGFHFGMM